MWFTLSCCWWDVIFKGRQWGLDQVLSTRKSFPSEAKPRIGTNSECLKTRSSPKWRPLNDFSESISVLAQWISVLVMSVSMNKPIVWNYILSPRTWTIISSPRTGKNSSSPLPSTSMVFQVRSRSAHQRVWLNDILMNYEWVWESLFAKRHWKGLLCSCNIDRYFSYSVPFRATCFEISLNT